MEPEPSWAQLSYAEAGEVALQTLLQSARQATKHVDKVWANLSGGFDSRMTTLLLSEIQKPFSTFNWVSEDFLDGRIPRKIAETMGWELLNLLDHEDDLKSRPLEWDQIGLGKSDGTVHAHPQQAYYITQVAT